MGGSSTGQSSTTTGILPQFLPAHLSLLGSGFAAARQAAGQTQPTFYNPAVSPFSPYSTGFTQQAQTLGNWPATGAAPQPAAQQANLGAWDLGSQYAAGGLGAKGWPSPVTQEQANQYMTQVSGAPIVGQAYPGPFIAPANQLELESLAAREAIARSLGGLGQGVMNLGQSTAAGDYLYAQSNPYLQSAIQAAILPQLNAYERVFAPQLASQAIQSGAYKGSSAREFADLALMQDVMSNIQSTAAQMSFQNLARERELQQQAPMLIDAAARLQQLSPEMLAQVGAGIRTLEQQQIDEALLRFQEQQMAPFRPLTQLASLLYGTNLGQVSTTQMGQPSPAALGITGALGGAALGSQIGNYLEYPGWGTALGGLLGGVGGALA